jgi:alkylation response protein AidB-like acyl-CoA dehydrogenase
MDTRDTPEQAELRRAASRLAADLGPATVGDLDDATRAKRLAVAVADAGWLELRDDGGDGSPVASGVEAGIVAEALGTGLADVAFCGPVLAADLVRRCGAPARDDAVIACPPTLRGPAVVAEPVTATPLVAVDTPDAMAQIAYVLIADDGGKHRLGQVPLETVTRERAADLTRSVGTIAAGTPVQVLESRSLSDDDLASFDALGLALTSADLVGVMRGVLAVTVAYASERRQFGVPIGSFQAVQHLLAEAHCLLEGSVSVAAHASWAVDELEPLAARRAGRVAKAYCTRAARTVTETAIQIHGGIGNTWDCIAHVYLRRGLLSSQWFGDAGEQLRWLADERLGGLDGLS